MPKQRLRYLSRRRPGTWLGLFSDLIFVVWNPLTVAAVVGFLFICMI